MRICTLIMNTTRTGGKQIPTSEHIRANELRNEIHESAICFCRYDAMLHANMTLPPFAKCVIFRHLYWIEPECPFEHQTSDGRIYMVTHKDSLITFGGQQRKKITEHCPHASVSKKHGCGSSIFQISNGRVRSPNKQSHGIVTVSFGRNQKSFENIIHGFFHRVSIDRNKVRTNKRLHIRTRGHESFHHPGCCWIIVCYTNTSGMCLQVKQKKNAHSAMHCQFNAIHNC
mmetsp:Transcript_133468/g.243246  ORF Transcript_133468/g.243246 Transcript_133468/m.243246 type:complete len:229 (-) Transcript_133468:720-1406(-)